MQPVCEYDDISRLDFMRLSRLDSYAHTVYEMLNDDENLDQISCGNLDETYETYDESLDQKNAEVSTRFLCQDMGIFPPCGLTNCHPYGTLARPTRP